MPCKCRIAPASRSSLCVYVVLDLLKIDENTALEVTIDGESLVVAPVRSQKRRARFEQALARSNARYGKALKRLAE